MKKLIVLFLMLTMFCCGGCSEGLLVGSGVAAGGGLVNTLSGAKKDLQARETYLIETYNQGVIDGAAVETLDGLKQKIRDNQLAQESVEVGTTIFGIDWNDSKEVGGGIGLVSALVYAWLNRKKKKQLIARDSAIAKFEGTSDPETAGKLHDIIKVKTAGIG